MWMLRPAATILLLLCCSAPLYVNSQLQSTIKLGDEHVDLYTVFLDGTTGTEQKPNRETVYDYYYVDNTQDTISSVEVSEDGSGEVIHSDTDDSAQRFLHRLKTMHCAYADTVYAVPQGLMDDHPITLVCGGQVYRLPDGYTLEITGDTEARVLEHRKAVATLEIKAVSSERDYFRNPHYLLSYNGLTYLCYLDEVKPRGANPRHYCGRNDKIRLVPTATITQKQLDEGVVVQLYEGMVEEGEVVQGPLAAMQRSPTMPSEVVKPSSLMTKKVHNGVKLSTRERLCSGNYAAGKNISPNAIRRTSVRSSRCQD